MAYPYQQQPAAGAPFAAPSAGGYVMACSGDGGTRSGTQRPSSMPNMQQQPTRHGDRQLHLKWVCSATASRHDDMLPQVGVLQQQLRYPGVQPPMGMQPSALPCFGSANGVGWRARVRPSAGDVLPECASAVPTRARTVESRCRSVKVTGLMTEDL